jgi:hypothetical protein
MMVSGARRIVLPIGAITFGSSRLKSSTAFLLIAAIKWRRATYGSACFPKLPTTGLCPESIPVGTPSHGRASVRDSL